MLFATTANAQKTSIWQRISVGATFNQVGTQNVQLGSGFLTNHPNRAIGTTVSMRLWKRFEVGGYLSTMHSFPFGYGGISSDFLNCTIHWEDNDLHITGGVLMAIHALPIGSDFAIDYVLRILTASQIAFSVSWLTSSASSLDPVGKTAPTPR